ncbi:hypothetical protein ACUN7Z_19865 [Vreelandella venusta]|uniref:hypothetical protein n=1 Tax=Vreelandella venusta TaxID=44935 RepID=UPI004044C2C6
MEIDFNSFSKQNNGQELKNIVVDRPTSGEADIPENHKVLILQHLDFINNIQNITDLYSYASAKGLDLKKTSNTYSISVDPCDVGNARLLFSIERNRYLYDIEYRKVRKPGQ